GRLSCPTRRSSDLGGTHLRRSRTISQVYGGESMAPVSSAAGAVHDCRSYWCGGRREAMGTESSAMGDVGGNLPYRYRLRRSLAVRRGGYFRPARYRRRLCQHGPGG